MQVNILGIRGIPAAHGGFETFAARLAPWLVARGHSVTVYCQDDDGPPGPWIDLWQGVTRVHLRPRRSGPAGTMEFDLACLRHLLAQPRTGDPTVDLVLGYNTALFNIIQRVRGRRIVMNMDGIEWRRAKWSLAAKIWFFVNEIAGANICHTAVADHPEIAHHLRWRCRKVPVMIPYGADAITSAPQQPLHAMGLVPGRYVVSIARIEPENSILDLVRAFSGLGDSSGAKCVVLGRIEEGNAYHAAVRAAAGPDVIFPGAIYDPDRVAALRFHARAYLHGHQVGGTNPSLVEALGAGTAVIAHDNRFNRWVAGPGQFYFTDATGARACMVRALTDDAAVASARKAARARHAAAFEWDAILTAYETVLQDTARPQGAGRLFSGGSR